MVPLQVGAVVTRLAARGSGLGGRGAGFARSQERGEDFARHQDTAAGQANEVVVD